MTLDQLRTFVSVAERQHVTRAAELVLSELGGLKRGTLLVQASQTIASYWLPRHLVAFRRSHPGIDIRLTVGNTTQVAAAIHEGSAELGFVEGSVDDPALESRVAARDQLAIVVGPDHHWATGAAVTPQDLAESDWVLR